MIDRISKIITDYFRIDTRDVSVSVEYLTPEKDPEKFDLVKNEYEKGLKRHDNNTVYLSSDLIVHIQQVTPMDELLGIKTESHFYHPICSKEEILRIENIKNTDDYLLKIRADSIADNSRFNRVFLSRYKKSKENKEDWSITKYYETNLFNSYVNKLDKKDRDMCMRASSGFALISEPNGMCMKTTFGNIILISESLQYFLYFMNVHLFCDIPNDDSMTAIIIAMRIFIESESLDFDLDTRGELPDIEKQKIDEALKWQLEFIIGHEYAHLLLGHLNNDDTKEVSRLMLNVKSDGYKNTKIYNQSEQQEFEADLASISNANYNENEKAYAVYHACLFLYYLHLGELASSYLYPSHDMTRTHPSSLDRVENLRNNHPDINNIVPVSEFENIETTIQHLEKYMREELLPYHTDELESYGSIYLRSYKKEFLQDRIDF